MNTPIRADDCVAECKKIVDAAEKTISARDEEIATQKDTINALISDLASATNTIDRDRNELNAWYRNPIFAIGLGFIVGGATVLYLKK